MMPPASATQSLSRARRLAITVTVMLASSMYALDWTIAAVALPHMQGTFSATQDQISWVLTSYIVISAIVLPTTAWLAERIGRKQLFIVAITGFTVSSALCGGADSLTAEIVYRLAQGGFGAFLIPLSQAILLDNYPPSQHAKAMAMWFAGGGTKGGHTIGATDEIGANAVADVHHIRDVHVTLLHLLGLDDNKLTYYHAGRFKQLSQFGGKVIKELIA